MRPSWRCAGGFLRVSGLSLLAVAAGCAPDFEKIAQTRSARGTLGAEVYKGLCRRVAGTEMPQDLDGRDSADVCLGNADTVATAMASKVRVLPPRVIALAERRSQIIDAVDAMFPGALAGDLEVLMRGLVPFYQPPNDLLPQNSRALGALMSRIAESAPALTELARVARAGMVPVAAEAGITGPIGGYPRLAELVNALVPTLLDGAAKREFTALREVLTMELATASAEDATERRRREDLERSAWLGDASGEDRFGDRHPLYTARRQLSGLPVAKASYPFVDADGDGNADLDGDRLAVDASFTRRLPEPFSVVGEADVSRDRDGRACALSGKGADCSKTLYAYTDDRDPTMFAATAREAFRIAGNGVASVVGSALVALPGLFEPAVARRHRYENASVGYPAVDREKSALLELTRAAAAGVPSAAYGESLAFTGQVLRELETPLVRVLDALASTERVTRPGNDAYPDAVLKRDHGFFDDLLWEAEKLSRRRLSADGEGAIEAMTRAALGFGRDTRAPGQPLTQLVSIEKLQHEGALLSNFMRFKDEWRLNPRGDSERGPDEPLLIGGFTTPVDRSMPDTPVTCGKDGCGGPIAGTTYEPYRQPNQNCMSQRAGRPAKSRDCGAPANQSILQRSLGLLWEMAGRSQCNKGISIGDLLNFVNEDACTVLDPVVTCSTNSDCTELLGAEFVCNTTAGTCFAPATSQSCALLQQDQQRQVDDTAEQAATALAKDYVCPSSLPEAPCHAYEAEFPAAFINSTGSDDATDAAVQACHLLNLKDVGRTFGRVLTSEFTLEIPNPWVRRYLEDVARASPSLALPDCSADFHIEDPTVAPNCVPEAAGLTRDFYETLPDDVDTLGELVEFLLDDSTLFATDDDTRDLRPDSKALSHVLFKATGKSSIQLFDTLLLRGSPKTCDQQPDLPACLADDTAVTPEGGCCIADLNNPPLRFRLDTYYGATSFAWEQAVSFSDGTTLSFLDTMRPLADAFNRLDYIEGVDDPKNFEDLTYGLTSIGKLVAEHYDTVNNPLAQSTNPDGSWYRRGTGIASYEPLVADVIDDGLIDVDQVGPLGTPLFAADALRSSRAIDAFRGALAFLGALDDLDAGGGDDGIDVSARVSEAMLNPHAYCAGDGGDGRVLNGKGACDGEAPVRSPLVRRDGRAFPCDNDGTCFDGKAAARRYLSPLSMLAAAAHDLDLLSRDDQRARDALRGVASAAIDAFLEFDAGKFASRRVRAIVLTGMAYAQTRWDEERAAGTLATYASDSEDRLDDTLEKPLTGAALELLRVISRDDDIVRELDALLASVLAPENAGLWTLLASDGFETARSGAPSLATSHALSAAISSNVDSVLADGGDLTFDGSYIDTNLRVLLEIAKRDDAGVLARVLANTTRPMLQGHTPMSVLTEAVLALQRVTPDDTRQVDADDLQHALRSMADTIADERRGFERLYRMVQCASGGDAACD